MDRNIKEVLNEIATSYTNTTDVEGAPKRFTKQTARRNIYKSPAVTRVRRTDLVNLLKENNLENLAPVFYDTLERLIAIATNTPIQQQVIMKINQIKGILDRELQNIRKKSGS